MGCTVVQSMRILIMHLMYDSDLVNTVYYVRCSTVGTVTVGSVTSQVVDLIEIGCQLQFIVHSASLYIDL